MKVSELFNSRVSALKNEEDTNESLADAAMIGGAIGVGLSVGGAYIGSKLAKTKLDKIDKQIQAEKDILKQQAIARRIAAKGVKPYKDSKDDLLKSITAKK
jgi:hypothetical protein